MSIAPDIQMEAVQIGGVTSPLRVYWRPRCLKCKWGDEPYPSKEAAQIAAGEHLVNDCLADSGGGDVLLPSDPTA